MEFRHPCSIIVSGSSGSGKTVLTRSLLQDFKTVTTIQKAVLNVWWCHGQSQDLHNEELPGVKIRYFKEFVSDFDDDDDKPDIVVYDDLMCEIADSKELTAVFTKKRHHEQISVILILQNLFFQSREMRTISLNTMYFVLMKNPRDRLQVMMLGRQIFPTESLYFSRVIADAFRDPFSHLIIDMTSECNDNHRLRQRVKDESRSGWFIWPK